MTPNSFFNLDRDSPGYVFLENRVHQLGQAVVNDPFRMLPMEVACIPEIFPHGPVPFLRNMVFRYNVGQFDRLTALGYRLNFLRGEYEKAGC